MLPSMEGRTIVRPDPSPYPNRVGCVHRPSMEGRTIVRPDSTDSPNIYGGSDAFNGGPDNCPARRDELRGQSAKHLNLQWRAGQLSGQTDRFNQGTNQSDRPSMEGRTIVRPDLVLLRNRRAKTAPSMEGRTIVRPDGPRVRGYVAVPVPSMEGRTIVRPDAPVRRALAYGSSAFNGGPDNCPARP